MWFTCSFNHPTMPYGLDQVHVWCFSKHILCITLLPVRQQRTKHVCVWSWDRTWILVLLAWFLHSKPHLPASPITVSAPSTIVWPRFLSLSTDDIGRTCLFGTDGAVHWKMLCSLPLSYYQMPTAPPTTSNIIRHGQWCVVEQNHLSPPHLWFENH